MKGKNLVLFPQNKRAITHILTEIFPFLEQSSMLQTNLLKPHPFGQSTWNWDYQYFWSQRKYLSRVPAESAQGCRAKDLTVWKAHKLAGSKGERVLWHSFCCCCLQNLTLWVPQKTVTATRDDRSIIIYHMANKAAWGSWLMSFLLFTVFIQFFKCGSDMMMVDQCPRMFPPTHEFLDELRMHRTASMSTKREWSVYIAWQGWPKMFWSLRKTIQKTNPPPSSAVWIFCLVRLLVHHIALHCLLWLLAAIHNPRQGSFTSCAARNWFYSRL